MELNNDTQATQAERDPNPLKINLKPVKRIVQLEVAAEVADLKINADVVQGLVERYIRENVLEFVAHDVERGDKPVGKIDVAIEALISGTRRDDEEFEGYNVQITITP